MTDVVKNYYELACSVARTREWSTAAPLELLVRSGVFVTQGRGKTAKVEAKLVI